MTISIKVSNHLFYFFKYLVNSCTFSIQIYSTVSKFIIFTTILLGRQQIAIPYDYNHINITKDCHSYTLMNTNKNYFTFIFYVVSTCQSCRDLDTSGCQLLVTKHRFCEASAVAAQHCRQSCNLCGQNFVSRL